MPEFTRTYKTFSKIINVYLKTGLLPAAARSCQNKNVLNAQVDIYHIK